ncbi:MAG: nickel pincer cofactor biosynthesis protein LarC [Deltaproteobacteria bacterium]|nr:nickel pincer cofactor biosynthesis protein LarC [Deltaproteobacteria bacterium]
MDRILHIDAPAGIAGDMTLAALLHAGADLDAVRDAVARVAGRVVVMDVEPCAAGAVRGLRLRVAVEDEAHERSARGILDAIAAAGLPPPVADAAARVLRRLAEAEGEVHGEPAGEVHFHEVGALDSIADVVGTAAALHSLGVTRVTASPLPLGRGYVGSRHGVLPLPAPATLALLRGWPAYGVDLEGETVTPTGAAICVALASPGPMPPMRIESVGCGFGTRTWPDGRPNCVRAVIGVPDERTGAGVEWEVAANIDDMTPDAASHLVEALFAAGAVDAWVTPIVMKKGRPAWTIHAVAPAAAREAVCSAFFNESTTIGLRMHALDRVKLAYEVRTTTTSLGPVRVKVASRGGRVVNVSAESDDLRRIARERGMPLKRVREVVAKEIG